MKKFLVAVVIAAVTLTAGIGSVQAKRLGGGGSFGKQSQGMSRQSAAPAQSTKPAAAAAAPAAAGAAAAAKPASAWKGMLGGALLGLGLGALLSHFGLGGAMASMLSTILMVALLAMAAMFIYRMFRRKSDAANASNAAQPAYAARSSGDFPMNADKRFDEPQQFAQQQPFARQGTPAIGSALGAAAGGTAGGAAYAAEPAQLILPADFDVTAFLRHSKTYFIRLQAAWDKADINDIREFSTSEMFAELKLQIQERGASSNHTDVMTLDAELMGFDTVGDDYLASVRFSGMIKEELNASAEAFAEVWNLAKPVNGNGGWLLAGIQQLDK